MKLNHSNIVNRLSPFNKLSKINYMCQQSFFSTQNANKSAYALNEEQKAFLSENGYLWLKDFIPRKVAQNCKNRIDYLLDNFDPQTTKSIFTTHRTETQYTDQYFLESGDKIAYFWEERAFDTHGTLTRPAKLAINKIGHALHTLDPIIHSYVYGYLPQLTYDVGMLRPIPIQCMYIFKQAGIGGEVGIHQDSSFLFTEPTASCHGFWLCIDDTTAANGCPWVVPKSHTIGLKNRFKRREHDNNATELVPLIGDGGLSKEGGIAVEAKCGDVVILHGEVVHWSDANYSEDARHALMVHCVDGEYQWAADNWLQYEEGNKAFPTFTMDDVRQQSNTRQKVVDYVLD